MLPHASPRGRSLKTLPLAIPMSLRNPIPSLAPSGTVRASLDPQESTVENGTDAPLTSQDDSHALCESFRHSGWANQRNMVMVEYDRLLGERDQQAYIRSGSGDPVDNHWPVSRSRNQAYLECGQDAYVMESVEHPGRYMITCQRCHDRFCLPCCRERASQLQAKLTEKIAGGTHRFITLTLRNSDDPLAVQLTRLYASFRRLRQRLFWKAHCTGGVAFCEVKYIRTTNRWHPHLHIVCSGRYMPQRMLSGEWYACTGDSYIVDIRPVRDPVLAARYVAKYATKGYDASVFHTPETLREAIFAFKSRRFVVCFGDWTDFRFGIPLSDKGWKIISAFSEMVRKAREGDPNATRILRALAPDWLPLSGDVTGTAPRPPPDTRTETEHPTPYVQRTLYDLAMTSLAKMGYAL